MAKILKTVREVATPLAERVDTVLQAQGQRIDVALETMSKDRRYMAEICLKTPLVAIMFFWMVLAPYFNYWLLDLPLLCIRYIGKLLPYIMACYFLIIFLIFILCVYKNTCIRHSTFCFQGLAELYRVSVSRDKLE